MKKYCPRHGVYEAEHMTCPTCIKQKRQDRDRIKGNASQRGYDTDWQKFRASVLKQPKYLHCWLSLVEDGKLLPAEQLHHIVKISDDDSRRLDINNVVPLTADKHKQVEANIAKGKIYDWASIYHAYEHKLLSLIWPD